MDRRLYRETIGHQRYAAQYRKPPIVVASRMPVGDSHSEPKPVVSPTAKPLASPTPATPQTRFSRGRVMDVVPLRAVSVSPAVSSRPAVAAGTTIDEQIMQGFVQPKTRRPIGAWLVYAMAGLIFCVGLSATAYSVMTTKKAEQQVLALTSRSGDDQASPSDAPPSEEPPKSSGQEYRVAPDMPRMISIPSLNVSARIVQVGVDKNNALRVPGNVYDAAWYTGSNTPGAAGAMVIDGHVSGPTKRGVFYNLKNLKTDDTISIERGDGTVFRYAVRHVETLKVDELDMTRLLVPYEPGRQGLNLITCGGTFDPDTSHFDSRVIVFAMAI